MVFTMSAQLSSGNLSLLRYLAGAEHNSGSYRLIINKSLIVHIPAARHKATPIFTWSLDEVNMPPTFTTYTRLTKRDDTQRKKRSVAGNVRPSYHGCAETDGFSSVTARTEAQPKLMHALAAAPRSAARHATGGAEHRPRWVHETGRDVLPPLSGHGAGRRAFGCREGTSGHTQHTGQRWCQPGTYCQVLH